MNTFPRWLLGSFAAVFAALLGAGAWFHHTQGQSIRRETEATVQSIAQLKANQIAEWRAERLADAAVLGDSPFLIDGLSEWLADPQPETTEDIRRRFRSSQKHDGYGDVLLADAQGQVRFSLSGRTGLLDENVRAAMAAAFRQRRPVLSDLHAGLNGLPAHIDTVAPLFAEDQESSKPVGAIVLQSDARRMLYPLIQSWPTPSRSAETVLVRRDGDAVLFLNELRHQPDTALRLRIPIDRRLLPAVMAAEGREGIVQGRDYRGVPVLAAVKAVPGSPWFLVAKVDSAEAMATWRVRSILIAAVVLGLVAASAAVTGVVWQRNGKAHYRALFHSEAARRKSEERYRTTLMSIGDGVIATDAEGRVELLNPVAETLTGWRQEEARGKPVAETFHIVNEHTRKPVVNPVARVLTEGTVVGLANHTVLIARDGVERPIADSGAPIREPEGQMLGVVLVFRDQTEDRAAQDELRRLNRALRTVSNCNQALVKTADEPSLLDQTCRIIRETGGYPMVLVSMVEEDEAETVRPAAQAGIDAAFLESLQVTWADSPSGRDPTGTAIRTGRRCVVADIGAVPEHSRWRELSLARGLRSAASFPLLSGQRAFGAITMWSGNADAFHEQELELLEELAGDLAYGITAVRTAAKHRQAEESLRESERRFRLLYEQLPVGYQSLDADGRLLEVNDAWLGMLGYAREEVIGRWFGELLPAGEDDAFRRRFQQYKARGSTQAEFEMTRRNGERVRIFFVGRIGTDERGRFKQTHSILTDVTERRRTEEQLRHAQKMEAVGQLAGGVAHDFRNQLTVIKGYGEMLLRESLLGDEGREHLRAILKAVDRSAATAGRLLAFARRQTLQPEVVNLTDELAGLAKSLPAMIGEDIRLVVAPGGGPCFANVDPGQLHQALLNLIVNARDAMPNGGELTLEAADVELDARAVRDHPGARPGRYSMLAVADTGPGISEEAMSHLFEPFFSTKEVGKGTGLGLPMVQGFVNQSGGFVEVDSKPGAGCTFRLYFPSAGLAARPAASAPGTAETAGGTETILVVEDEESVRVLATRQLRALGYTVLEAVSPKAALALLEEHTGPLDLLVTDVVMPEYSGVELASRVRELRPGTPVLFVSGYAGADLTRRGLVDTETHFLSKPFSGSQLAQCVRAALGRC